MTIATVTLRDRQVQVDLAAPFDLAIPLQFNGKQPVFFGAPPARREPLTSGDWIGDTHHGGNCNAETLTLTPHCNGTHTECVSHLVNQSIAITDAVPDTLAPAWLVSIEGEPVETCTDELPDDIPTGQTVISRAQLQQALAEVPDVFLHAVIIRSLPNRIDKQHRNYDDGKPVTFMTTAATQWLVDHECEHLLLDIPSLDYSADPDLAAHRVFFGLPPGSHDSSDAQRPQCTITEMIFVDNAIEDGACLLDLQVPAFQADAAPSRPLIYRIENT